MAESFYLIMKKMNIYYLVGLVIILIGTYVAYIGSSRDSEKTIQDLKDSLNLKNQELQQKQVSLEKKQDENNVLSEKILQFQEKLDSNTDAIGKATDEISKISIKTNQISNIIKNEQRQKGAVEFETNDYEYYFVDLGMVAGMQKKSDLQREETNFINGIPFTMFIKKDKFLVSLNMKDKDGNLIFAINRGKWAINKNEIFSVNYDLNGIEVIDKRGDVILQIDLIENRFRVIGTFFESDGVTLIHPQLLAKVLYSEKNYKIRLKEFQMNIKRKFVNYGEDYLGKRLKN